MVIIGFIYTCNSNTVTFPNFWGTILCGTRKPQKSKTQSYQILTRSIAISVEQLPRQVESVNQWTADMLATWPLPKAYAVLKHLHPATNMRSERN